MAKRYAGIDRFRMAAAFMIVAIHTAPFAVFGEKADVIVTYCLFRVGVPFFLMVTGFFVLSACGEGGDDKLRRYLGKTAGIYLAATILYLPLNLYAGKLPENMGAFLRVLLFDGTFYHLWYLPAVILGCMVIRLLCRTAGFYGSGAAALFLYVIGTLGDSYYGLVSGRPAGKAFYDGIFACSEYTRNGIFYAPLFLWMGAALRKKEAGAGRGNSVWQAAGLALSAALMAAEGQYTYVNGWQRHNSMYFMLPPVMYFLFRLLLAAEGKSGRGVPGSVFVDLPYPPGLYRPGQGSRQGGGTDRVFGGQFNAALSGGMPDLPGGGICNPYAFGCGKEGMPKEDTLKGTKSDA